MALGEPRILVAPNAFKGSLTSVDAARIIAAEIRAVLPGARLVEVPLSDGGDGFLDSVLKCKGGKRHRVSVVGPLGEPVEAEFGVVDGGRTAVIESARASGLSLIPRGRLDPLRATSYGTGQLIRAALDLGVSKILLGIGGSATVDGGAGALAALGLQFYGERGMLLGPLLGGGDLASVREIVTSGLDQRVSQVEILIACDVENPLLGPSGAAAVYGPQKGAGPEQVKLLEAALAHYAALVEEVTGNSISHGPRMGAAGGLGAGLYAFAGAKLMSGFRLVCEIVGMESLMEEADLVITGEGRTDAQTAFGKVPTGVLWMGRERGIPVVLLSGSISGQAESLGFDAAISCVTEPMTVEDALRNAPALLAWAAERVARFLALGARLGRERID